MKHENRTNLRELAPDTIASTILTDDKESWPSVVSKQRLSNFFKFEEKILGSV